MKQINYPKGADVAADKLLYDSFTEEEKAKLIPSLRAWIEKTHAYYYVTKYDIHHDDRERQIAAEWDIIGMYRTKYVTPKCCEKVQNHLTVLLEVDYTQPVDKQNPHWVVRGMNDSQNAIEMYLPCDFCPHCGEPTPQIKLRETDEDICVVTDGGYYCETCKQRVDSCKCEAPAYRFEPAEEKLAIFLMPVAKEQ